MSYSYTKHSWEDKPSSNTPITAEKLNEMEEGIYNANENKVDKEDGKGLSTNDLTNDLITDIALKKKSSHTHSNKATLDGITNLSVDKWNTVDNKVDKVPGKGLSENDFTSTLKSNYDNAVTNSHTHTNKTVLDNFSESGGQLLYSGESISGKTEIDDTQSSTDTTYSSSKIEELIGAGGGGGGGTPNALTKEVVTELPSYENAKDNVLYLIEDTTTPVPAEGLIDDENVSSTTTYSSQKITDLLDNKVDDTNFTAHTTNTDIHVTPDKKTSWDNAVTNSHTHNNKKVLDKFSESSDGNLLYDGSSIGGGGGIKFETTNISDISSSVSGSAKVFRCGNLVIVNADLVLMDTISNYGSIQLLTLPYAADSSSVYGDLLDVGVYGKHAVVCIENRSNLILSSMTDSPIVANSAIYINNFIYLTDE